MFLHLPQGALHVGEAFPGGGDATKFGGGHGGCAHDDAVGRNIGVDHGFSGNLAEVADVYLVIDADLSANDDAIAQAAAPGHACLSSDRAGFANGAAVTNLDEIVDLGVAADAGFADGGAIDGTVAADFYAVFEDGAAGLLHLEPAVAGGDETEAFGTDDCAAVDDAICADLGALVEGAVGVEDGAIAHGNAGVQHDVGMDANMVAKDAACLDHHICADGDMLAEGGGGVDDGAGVNAGGGLKGLVKQGDRLGKEEARVGGGDPGDGAIAGGLLQGGILGQDQGAGGGGGDLLGKFTAFDVAESAAGGRFDGGDRADVWVKVGLLGEAAIQSVTWLAELVDNFAKAHFDSLFDRFLGVDL